MIMKYYKNIACTDFVNLNIALNLHSYEESYSYTGVHMTDLSLVVFKL